MDQWVLSSCQQKKAKNGHLNRYREYVEKYLYSMGLKISFRKQGI